MAAFTKGPWHTHLVLPGAQLNDIEEHGMIANVYGLHNGILTEHGIFSESAKVDTSNAEADARMIAAAPSMHAALDHVSCDCEIFPVTEGDGVRRYAISEEALRSVRAALALADGG